MKPVKVRNEDGEIKFESYASCSRYLSKELGKTFDSIRYKLKHHRLDIDGYEIIYS